MSAKNPEYDFKWCPGCGDFGVRRALESAIEERGERTGEAIYNNVIVAGIGCSGNLVHLYEGEQPYGLHGIHGRTLPLAFGVKMGRPDLNVVVVAGDGDFLSIGQEHIAPQAARNLDITCVIMDNGVYGLTKGQSSPTAEIEMVTNSTPYGKLEVGLNPLQFFLSIGVSFVAAAFSGKPKDLAKIIGKAMDHPGFAIVNVQSPCTTYNDTFEALKGSAKKGIEPALYDVPEDHDPTNWNAAMEIARADGVPAGILYQQPYSQPLHQKVADIIHPQARMKSVEEMLEAFAL